VMKLSKIDSREFGLSSLCEDRESCNSIYRSIER